MQQSPLHLYGVRFLREGLTNGKSLRIIVHRLIRAVFFFYDISERKIGDRKIIPCLILSRLLRQAQNDVFCLFVVRLGFGEVFLKASAFTKSLVAKRNRSARFLRLYFLGNRFADLKSLLKICLGFAAPS